MSLKKSNREKGLGRFTQEKWGYLPLYYPDNVKSDGVPNAYKLQESPSSHLIPPPAQSIMGVGVERDIRSTLVVDSCGDREQVNRGHRVIRYCYFFVRQGKAIRRPSASGSTGAPSTAWI